MGDEAEHIGYDGGYFAEQDLDVEIVRFVLGLSNKELVERIHRHIRSYTIFKIDVRDLIYKCEKGGYRLFTKQREFLENAYLYINYDIVRKRGRD